jgi:hypothetical protein
MKGLFYSLPALHAVADSGPSLAISMRSWRSPSRRTWMPLCPICRRAFRRNSHAAVRILRPPKHVYTAQSRTLDADSGFLLDDMVGYAVAVK